jgi:GMP synthase-like glutamine amidotransferase
MRTLILNFYRRDSEKKMPYYHAMVGHHSQPVEVAGERVESAYPLDGFEAVVITGSQWMLADEDAPAAIKEFCRSLHLPTFGICFGHQLLARSFGAVVTRGEKFLEFDEAVEVLRPWPLFDGLPACMVMRESHREYVTPESAREIGWDVGARSASCPIEAMRHPRLPLYGVQFHPERSGPNGEALFANFYSGVVRPWHKQRGG